MLQSKQEVHSTTINFIKIMKDDDLKKILEKAVCPWSLIALDEPEYRFQLGPELPPLTLGEALRELRESRIMLELYLKSPSIEEQKP